MGEARYGTFLFTKSILEGNPIKVFNHGNMMRDFTYIDDIVESLIRVIKKSAEPDNKFNSKKPLSSSSWAPYKIFNIGNSNPTPLMEFIKAIEKNLGIEAKKDFCEMQRRCF